MEKNMTCIVCPIGCALTVRLENGEIESVTGNVCKRGIKYAQEEINNPLRIVTSTVRINSEDLAAIPVKTVSGIPKGKIFECLKVLKEIELEVPVKIGDIIVENICNTGVNIVATRNVKS